MKLLPLLIATALVPASVLEAQTYMIQDLGTLGGASSEGNAINATGQVAGESDTGNTSLYEYQRPFLSGPNGGPLVNVGSLGGNAYGVGVNDSGQVVASFFQTDDTTLYHMHAFLSGPNGAGPLHDIGTLGGVGCRGSGVNNSGQVTGRLFFSGDTWHAFLSGPNGAVLRDLGTLGGTRSEGHAVNAIGQVAGVSQTIGDAAYHAFLSGPNGAALTDLGTLGGTNSWATAVNANGQVAGYSEFSPGFSGHYAFVSAPNGGPLTMLGGGRFSAADAYGVNASGQVVGTGLFYTAGNQAWHAFVYTPEFGMQSLNFVLPNGYGYGTYLFLVRATAINDSGQITAYGYDYGSGHHAYLLTPIPKITSISALAENGTLQLSGLNISAQNVTIKTTSDLAQPFENFAVTQANGGSFGGGGDFQLQDDLNVRTRFYRVSYPTSFGHPSSAFQWSASIGGNNHWYEVVQSPGRTWPDARDYARSKGGHLATITSAAENDFIKSITPAGAAPIVGAYKDDKGWHWITGEAFIFTDWAGGEPNNDGGVEDCLQFIGSDGTWNDGARTAYLYSCVIEYPN